MRTGIPPWEMTDVDDREFWLERMLDVMREASTDPDDKSWDEE